MICYNHSINKRKYSIWPLDVASSTTLHYSCSCTYLQIVWYCTKSIMYAINTSICNVFPWKRLFKLPFDRYCKFWQLYILRHYTVKWCQKNLKLVYFLSNAPCYIQIKFRDHKLIILGTTIENIYPKIKKSTKFYILEFLLWRLQKIKQNFFHESRVQVLIFRLSLEWTFYAK